MRILLIGKSGQLGWELEQTLASHELVSVGRAELDLADLAAIRKVTQHARPEVIVNAAAYTAVDRAEGEPAAAMAINAVAPGILAEEAKRSAALLVHYSTDYVFDGAKDEPYTEQDAPNPLNVYGLSKLKGEEAILASGCRHLILRTSWVYAPRGRNFLLSILKAAGEQRVLRVVEDQWGAPTSAAVIALATAQIVRNPVAAGLYHLSAAGRTTWHGFAEEIVRKRGLSVPVIGVSTEAFGAKARRPRNSLLDNSKLERDFGISLDDWRSELGRVMTRLKD